MVDLQDRPWQSRVRGGSVAPDQIKHRAWARGAEGGHGARHESKVQADIKQFLANQEGMDSKKIARAMSSRCKPIKNSVSRNERSRRLRLPVSKIFKRINMQFAQFAQFPGLPGQASTYQPIANAMANQTSSRERVATATLNVKPAMQRIAMQHDDWSARSYAINKTLDSTRTM